MICNVSTKRTSKNVGINIFCHSLLCEVERSIDIALLYWSKVVHSAEQYDSLTAVRGLPSPPPPPPLPDHAHGKVGACRVATQEHPVCVCGGGGGIVTFDNLPSHCPKIPTANKQCRCNAYYVRYILAVIVHQQCQE